MTYHGKTIEQAQWVLDYFGTSEKREYYKDNKSYQLWLEESERIVNADSDSE